MSNIKPFKIRIQYYISIFLLLIPMHLGLLMTGYEYTRNKGFYKSGADPMSFVEALIAMPNKLWLMYALFLGIILIIEGIIFQFTRN